MARQAEAEWKGDLKGGNGRVKTGSGGYEGNYSFATRFEDGKGANPEELLGAAHAGCFSMALANELGDAGYTPDQIDTIATVTMENSSPGWTMTQIHLDVIATVARARQCDFIDATLRAKASCPISRVLNANISMRARMKRVRGTGQEP